MPSSDDQTHNRHIIVTILCPCVTMASILYNSKVDGWSRYKCDVKKKTIEPMLVTADNSFFSVAYQQYIIINELLNTNLP